MNMLSTVKLTAFSLLLFLTGAGTALSQENNNKQPHPASYFIYMAGGVQMPGIGGLNNALVANGNAALDKQRLALGGGLGINHNRVMVAADYSRYEQCKENEQEVCSHITSNTATLVLGWNLLKDKKLALLPVGGISMNSTKLNITDTEVEETEFAAYMATVQNQVEMKCKTINATGGIRLHYSPPLCKEPSKRLLLGVQSGYHYPLSKSKWVMHEHDDSLQDGPALNAAGFYARLVVGIQL